MLVNDLLLNSKEILNTYLYNLNLVLDKPTLGKFANIRYVLMQGSAHRTKLLAQKLAIKLINISDKYFEPKNLFKNSMYVAYRIDDVLCVSHGMGNTSILTLLHNLSKLLYLAGNRNFEYIRIGTSGGIGIKPGSVILTKTAYMPNLIAGYKMSTLGKDIIYPAKMDIELNQKIIDSQPSQSEYSIFIGNTIAADDFYLSQARFDGAIIPKYTKSDRERYFLKLKELNILNIEMESNGLAYFCNRAQIPVAMVAAIIVDRTENDQVALDKRRLAEFSDRPQNLIINYLLQ